MLTDSGIGSKFESSEAFKGHLKALLDLNNLEMAINQINNLFHSAFDFLLYRDAIKELLILLGERNILVPQGDTVTINIGENKFTMGREINTFSMILEDGSLATPLDWNMFIKTIEDALTHGVIVSLSLNEG